MSASVARRTTVLVAAALIGAALALTATTPAAAHDELISSFPRADTTVDNSPDEITLGFSAALNPDPTSIVIEVIDSDGENHVVDPPAVEDETFVTQHLRDDPPNGVFTVRWKVVSSDGHPISGEYSYTVAATISPTSVPTATATPNPTSEPTIAAENDAGASGADEPTGGGAILLVLVIVTGAIILGGAVVVVMMVGRQRRRRDKATAAQAGRNDGE